MTDRKAVDDYLKGKTADDFDPEKLIEKVRSASEVTVSGQTILAYKSIKERKEALSNVRRLKKLVANLMKQVKAKFSSKGRHDVG